MDASIAIDTSRRLGLISPLLYGLRGADTFKNDTPLMWVGPDSPIANIDGVRRGTVEALRQHLPREVGEASDGEGGMLPR